LFLDKCLNAKMWGVGYMRRIGRCRDIYTLVATSSIGEDHWLAHTWSQSNYYLIGMIL
jgi:hypothetical protein